MASGHETTVTIRLEIAAREVALSAAARQAEVWPPWRCRALLAGGHSVPSMPRMLEVLCTPLDAQELAEYFRVAAEAFAHHLDPAAARFCRSAQTSIRYALRRAQRRAALGRRPLKPTEPA
jgi:hypothetical protein